MGLELINRLKKRLEWSIALDVMDKVGERRNKKYTKEVDKTLADKTTPIRGCSCGNCGSQ